MKKLLLTACLAALICACSQKQSVVQVPPSQIDVEKLLDSIDYDMDVSGLSLADIRTLRNAPAAQRGLPFRDSYIRGIYNATTWYDSLMWKFDEKVESAGVESKDDESWRDFYYRIIDEKNLLNYNEQEKAFIQRMQEREDELVKQNFEVPEGLRVNMANLLNPTQIKDIDEQLSQRLGEDGFAIVPARHNQLFEVYEQNDYREFPNFVTTDLYLQLYHLYFDCMLRELEENYLLKLMTDFSHDMFYEMHRQLNWSGFDETVSQAALKNCVYYSIAYYLFTGEYLGTDEVTKAAQAEVALIMAAQDNYSTFMKDYKEVSFGYSLFRPRGHYTRSEKLQRYFRGMMWLQTANFGLNNKDEVQAAVMQTYAFKYDDKVVKKYETLNSLITFLMGKPDDLTIMQVWAEVKKLNMQMEDLLHNDQAIEKLTATLNKIGNKQTRIRPKFEKTSHNKINIMPQRYQPDAEVLQEMVDYDNKPTQRATPKGLDFFAAMRVPAAERILIDEQNQWKGFTPMLEKMKMRMQEIKWGETIATEWMSTLRSLCDHDPQLNLPYFMVTKEWDLKDLNAMLASWAELKHDAILYAKQPAGAECGGGGPPEPVVKGYVEPNIGFWKKAIALLDNTERLLKEENMLTKKISEATERIREEAQFLLNVSEKELAGKELTEEEYDQLQYIGATFENISLDLVREPDQYLMGWSDVQGADKKVALVADVYTANADNNPEKSILFEAVGDADEIYVVVEIGGYLYLTRGAVLSYREFIQPINLPRLTDEEWQEQLEKNPRKGVPEWMKRIIVPLNNMPEVNEEFFYSSGC
ncbi:MAG: DUF3160 domain-containing protein [Bacteroidaceae bacterium]|nr:DUF3160 domain-containing protein [Bacteroidaceae bacterium]